MRAMSSGLGGLNKSPHGVVIGVVQLQLPQVVTPADLAAQTARVVAMVGKARRNNPATDLVVGQHYHVKCVCRCGADALHVQRYVTAFVRGEEPTPERETEGNRREGV